MPEVTAWGDTGRLPEDTVLQPGTAGLCPLRGQDQKGGPGGGHVVRLADVTQSAKALVPPCPLLRGTGESWKGRVTVEPGLGGQPCTSPDPWPLCPPPRSPLPPPPPHLPACDSQEEGLLERGTPAKPSPGAGPLPSSWLLGDSGDPGC